MHASEHPPQCSVLPGTGVALLELSVSSSVCSVLGAARYRCGATGVVCLIVCLFSARCCQVQVWRYWSCLSHHLSAQCSVLPGTGVALLELSVSSSVCSVLGAARYRCGATGVVCLIICLLSARCCQVQVWRYWSCLSPICHDSVSDSWALVLLAITRGYSELELKIPRCWKFCFIACSERSRCIWSNYFQF